MMSGMPVWIARKILPCRRSIASRNLAAPGDSLSVTTTAARYCPKGSDWKGPDSYHANPYPCPRACAPRLSRRYRGKAEPGNKYGRRGALNTWKYEDSAGVMRIKGGSENSCGYRYGPLSLTSDAYPELSVTIEGSKNARYYVDVLDGYGNSFFGSKWIDTPTEAKEQTFQLKPGTPHLRHHSLYYDCGWKRCPECVCVG